MGNILRISDEEKEVMLDDISLLINGLVDYG